MTERKLQAAETKKMLLVSAEKLIAEKGFDNVSINDITKDCGVAVGTFYLYFRSKNDLLIHFSKNVREKLEEAFAQLPDVNALEKLRFMLDNWFSIMNEWDKKLLSQTYRVYFDLLINNELEIGIRADYKAEFIRALLNEAVQQKSLSPDTPVDFIATLLGVVMYGSVVYSQAEIEGFSLNEWKNELIAYVFDKILKPYII